jgi:hypothetical protein
VIDAPPAALFGCLRQFRIVWAHRCYSILTRRRCWIKRFQLLRALAADAPNAVVSEHDFSNDERSFYIVMIDRRHTTLSGFKLIDLPSATGRN